MASGAGDAGHGAKETEVIERGHGVGACVGARTLSVVACMYSWFRRPSGSRSSMRWMVVAIALFAIGTCDVSFNFYHNILAFIDYKGSGGADEEFQDASNWVNVMKVRYHTPCYVGIDIDCSGCRLSIRR